MNRTHSHEIYSRAKQLMPGGVNSAARAFGGVGGEPIVFERAQGAYWFGRVAGFCGALPSEVQVMLPCPNARSLAKQDSSPGDQHARPRAGADVSRVASVFGF